MILAEYKNMPVYTETILTIIIGTISHRVRYQLITVGASPSWETFLGTIWVTAIVGVAIIHRSAWNGCGSSRGSSVGKLAAVTIVT